MASNWVTKEDPRVPESLFTSAIGVSLMELPVGKMNPTITIMNKGISTSMMRRSLLRLNSKRSFQQIHPL
jgi:hypothetical protein